LPSSGWPWTAWPLVSESNHTHEVQPEHQPTLEQETSIDKVSCVLHLSSTSKRLNEKRSLAICRSFRKIHSTFSLSVNVILVIISPILELTALRHNIQNTLRIFLIAFLGESVEDFGLHKTHRLRFKTTLNISCRYGGDSSRFSLTKRRMLQVLNRACCRSRCY
jgi:hypothetical protein